MQTCFGFSTSRVTGDPELALRLEHDPVPRRGRGEGGLPQSEFKVSALRNSNTVRSSALVHSEAVGFVSQAKTARSVERFRSLSPVFVTLICATTVSPTTTSVGKVKLERRGRRGVRAGHGEPDGDQGGGRGRTPGLCDEIRTRRLFRAWRTPEWKWPFGGGT